MSADANLFIVVWDDSQGLCFPMVFDEECEGAITGGLFECCKIALFQSRKSARRAIDISVRWNALLKAQGKIYSQDFEGEAKKNILIIPCEMRPDDGKHND